MNKLTLSLTILTTVGIMWFGPHTTHAADDGQIGFVVDNEFSSFLSVDGEIAFDFFARLRDLPGFDGATNTKSTFLNEIGFFEAIEATNGEPFFIGVVMRVFTEFFGIKYVFSPDPFVSYELEILNTTDQPMEVLFSISPPIIPVIGENEIIAQLSVELFDENNDGSVLVDSLGPDLQQMFLIEDDFILQSVGADIGIDVNETGKTSFSTARLSGPQSETGWQFIDVLLNFTLSPGDRVVVTGVAGVGNPGTFLPVLDELKFSNLDAIADCINDDGGDDDADGVPNGCDECPGEDDLVDADDDGTPDCLGEKIPDPGDDGDGNNDGGDGDTGNAGDSPNPFAALCGTGAASLVPLSVLGLMAMRRRR